MGGIEDGLKAGQQTEKMTATMTKETAGAAGLKFAVLLGGPLHGSTRWMKQPLELIERQDDGWYRFAFGDDHVVIYYWRLTAAQMKAVRQQVDQLRARHGDFNQRA